MDNLNGGVGFVLGFVSFGLLVGDGHGIWEEIGERRVHGLGMRLGLETYDLLSARPGAFQVGY